MIPLLLLSFSIVSGDKICAPDDPTSCRQAVVTGETVPFDGQLLTPKRAAKLAVQAGQCQERTDEAVANAKAVVGMDLRLQKQLRQNDLDHAAQSEKLLTEELERAHQAAGRSFLESPVLWFALGIVATVAVTAGTVALFDATRPAVLTIPVSQSTPSSGALIIGQW